jgi:hypothetical protein
VERGAVEEGDAFVVGGVPGVFVGGEGESLLVVGLVGEQGAALASVAADFFPEDVAYAGSGGAEEDAWGYFEQPAGEEAA